VLLGKLLVSPANMLLLDEPTNHLDMESTDSLIEAIDDFNGSVIIVTHSEMILHALATRLIVFDDGKVTLFEGTYQDFLDRVGWKNESGTAQSKTMTAKTEAQGVNKKQLRRIRAELLNEKSRALKAINTKIEKAEAGIIRLEGLTEQLNRDILEASLAGNGKTITELSKALHDSRSGTETLFSELEVLHAELDNRTKEFEEKLQGVSEQ